MTVVIEVRDYRFYLPDKPIRIPVNVPVEFVVVSDDMVMGSAFLGRMARWP